MKIALTGGGTAGHVVPNFAVIEGLKTLNETLPGSSSEHSFLYIGSRAGVEKKMAEKFGIDYKGVSCGKLRRYFSFRNFIDPFKIPVGILQARGALKKFTPDVLFSKGGFVSVPVVLAAVTLKIPIITHESDVIPGLANKIGARFAKKICLSFEESKKYLEKYSEKIVFTGNPVREKLAHGSREDALKFTKLTGEKPAILVIGGSQGAVQINNLVRKTLDDLLKDFEIVHSCGKGNVDKSLERDGYTQYEYLDEQLPDIFALCDLVVSRGGANTLAEIAFLGKKAVIIPLGEDVSRGDQVKNAEVFAKKYGWEVFVPSSGETDDDGADFLKAVRSSYKLSPKGSELFENGTKKIAELILKFKK